MPLLPMASPLPQPQPWPLLWAWVTLLGTEMRAMLRLRSEGSAQSEKPTESELQVIVSADSLCCLVITDHHKKDEYRLTLKVCIRLKPFIKDDLPKHKGRKNTKHAAPADEWKS